MKAKEETYVFFLTVGMFYSRRFFTAVRCPQEANITAHIQQTRLPDEVKAPCETATVSFNTRGLCKSTQFGITLCVSELYVRIYLLKLKP